MRSAIDVRFGDMERTMMRVISTTELPYESRSGRSSLTRRVNDALEKFLRRGVFEQLELGKVRVGRMTHRILWHHNRVYRFVLDLDAGAVMFPSILPATLPPQLLRELRCFLRPPSGAGNGQYLLDAERGELRVFVQHGALTLSVTVKNDAYEYCIDNLIGLADGILSSFLDQPAYFKYRTNSLVRAETHVDERRSASAP